MASELAGPNQIVNSPQIWAPPGVRPCGQTDQAAVSTESRRVGPRTGNSRNGYGRKAVTTETGRIELEIPRDRQASFDPQLIAKYQRRFPSFDDKIISIYARGVSARGSSGI
jgi:transposase-like protein